VNLPSVSEAVHAGGKRGTKSVETKEIGGDKVGELKRGEEDKQWI